MTASRRMLKSPYRSGTAHLPRYGARRPPKPSSKVHGRLGTSTSPVVELQSDATRVTDLETLGSDSSSTRLGCSHWPSRPCPTATPRPRLQHPCPTPERRWSPPTSVTTSVHVSHDCAGSRAKSAGDVAPSPERPRHDLRRPVPDTVVAESTGTWQLLRPSQATAPVLMHQFALDQGFERRRHFAR